MVGFILTVIEVGIILHGLPIFRADYHAEVKGDPALRSGMFSAIQSFAKEAFGDETEELRLKNLTICFITINIAGNEAVVFAVAGKATKNVGPVRSALNKVASKLLAIDAQFNTLQPEKNEFVRPIFEEYFADLRMRPAERAKRLFG